MRQSRAPPTLLSLLAIVLSSCPSTGAKPYPRDALLQERNCAPCGWEGKICCTADQQCTTDAAGQAQCVAAGPGQAGVSAQAGGAGHWEYYTTTIVQTDLVTKFSTYSSFVGAAPTAQATAQAASSTTAWAPAVTSEASQCSIPCGGICCAQGQYCAVAGQCVAVGAAGDFSSAYYSSAIYGAAFSSALVYSAPLRPTSGFATTATSFAGAITATVPFQTPIGTAGGVVFGTAAATAPSSGLSGGAIAGIVIGVIAAILLLLFLCLRLCFQGAKGVVGGGRRRREETTYIRESHHRHSGRKWYGAQASGKQQQKKSGVGGAGAVLAGLGTLALALGLKRKYDKRKDDSSTSYGTGSYVSYSDYTDESPSSTSSDPRSRR